MAQVHDWNIEVVNTMYSVVGGVFEHPKVQWDKSKLRRRLQDLEKQGYTILSVSPVEHSSVSFYIVYYKDAK